LSNILIFGNSASGKLTLAKKLCRTSGLAHLDLDLLAWQPSSPPQRMPVEASAIKIHEFMGSHKDWVIEGCYTDLLEIAAPHSTDMIFMQLPVEACIENAKRRPWKPHKYQTAQAQDANLQMLLEWIAEYPSSTDTFSQSSHLALYQQYTGQKRIIVKNE
jgi:adenylate kinase family enzyme